MNIKRLDHIVINVSNLEKSFRFYHEVFDMQEVKEQSTADTITIRAGHQLIRLQKTDSQKELSANKLETGTADFCLVAGDKLDDIVNHLKSYFVDIVAGPVEKIGSEGNMTSIYVHDPDLNLVEIATYKK